MKRTLAAFALLLVLLATAPAATPIRCARITLRTGKVVCVCTVNGRQQTYPKPFCVVFR